MRKLDHVVALCSVAALAGGCGPKLHDVAAPSIAASDDQELIARGEYLFHGPSHCSACHTPKEIGIGMKAGDKPEPIGGGIWEMGPIGTMYSPNLTSDKETGVGARSDGELARTLRHGVLPDGRLSFFMALAVGRLADDDIQAIISYMRTLPPKKNAVPTSEMGMLGNMVFGGAPPKRPGLEKAPPLGATVERGKYLAEAACNCVGCHSQLDMDKWEIKAGTAFAGGDPMESEFKDDGNKYVPRNITPDKDTGLGSWTEEQFLARFKQGRTARGSAMPWANYQNMQEDDLKAIWMYLQTVPAVKRDTGPTVVPK